MLGKMWIIHHKIWGEAGEMWKKYLEIGKNLQIYHFFIDKG